MTETVDGIRLIELVIDKHNRFLDIYRNEFSEIESKLNTFRQKHDDVKKEMGQTEERIMIFNEKFHLLFHQAKKQREEIFNRVLARMHGDKAPGTQDIMRIDSRLREIEGRLQTSKNIEDEEKMITEIKDLLSDLEATLAHSGINVSCEGIINKLYEAHSSHKELLGITDTPEKFAESIKEYDSRIKENEERYNWLMHRIESHSNALAYWEKQKDEMKVERT